MPKSFEKRICEAQRQRVLISDRGDKYGPSKVTLQVIGSGARGAPKSVYLFTDKKRYLFNCGEGTQRLAHEHKMKLALLENIFITTNTWDSMGGLPGISLTLQDVGVPKLNLHGPPGLKTLYKAMDRFMMMNHLDIGAPDCDPLAEFEDSTMTVKYVPLGPPKSQYEDQKAQLKATKILEMEENFANEFEHDNTEYYSHYTKRSKSRSPSPTSTQKSAHSPKTAKPSKVKEILNDLKRKPVYSMAYICTLKKRLGTLDKSKCMSLGLKPGPWLGQLKRGEDVVLPDGTLLHASQFKTPDEPGSIFIVIDVPDLLYLKESSFKDFMDTPDVLRENIPAVVVHFTPKHICNSSRYLQFMSMFGPQTRHMLVNDHNTCLGSLAVHRMQHKLHILSPHIFPLLHERGPKLIWTTSAVHQITDTHASKRRKDDPDDIKEIEELNSKIAVAQFESIISAQSDEENPDIGAQALSIQAGVSEDCIVACRSLTAFHLLPKNGLDRANEFELDVVEFISESMAVPGFPSALQKLQRQSDQHQKPQTPYPRIVFLGTGSCIPNKTRNTSGIVLEIDENRVIMMDCGEGTYGQLLRFYGSRKANQLLCNLKAIYISHLHADHHIGLIGVLQGRRRAIDELKQSSTSNGAENCDLYLLAPGQIMTWLAIYNLHFEEIKQEYILIPNTTLLKKEDQSENVLPPSVLSHLGVASIQTCFVRHCPNAFGVAITTLADEKITYSGDTMPCDSLVVLGLNSDILIHEATMEDELETDALAKRHSTTSQAIEAGRRMRARFTLLTHFSQRYARLPRFTQPLLDSATNVGIAFDNMQVSIPDLRLLPHMYEPLQLMFAEHCNELEVKAAKRAVRESRTEPDTSTSTSILGLKTTLGPNTTHGLTIIPGLTSTPSPITTPGLTSTPSPITIPGPDMTLAPNTTHGLTILPGLTSTPSPVSTPSPITTPGLTSTPSPISIPHHATNTTATHETNETQCTTKDLLGDIISKIHIKNAETILK